MVPTRTALGELLETARRAWPTVDVPDEIFFAYVEARMGDEPVERLSTAELYLAAGCAMGEPNATAAFERTFAGDLAPS